ncbi:MAG TPA: hypothetical protein VNR65_04725, partial [Geobacterales bacterium]|nr:hypothetical protein [Geobacterales bacterium]
IRRAPVNHFPINARRGDERFTIRRAASAVQHGRARLAKHAIVPSDVGGTVIVARNSPRRVPPNCVATGSDLRTPR